MIGAAIAAAGIDFVDLRAVHKSGAVRLLRAVVYSDADAQRLRDWCVSGWHVPVVVGPGAIRVATPEEIEACDQLQESES